MTKRALENLARFVSACGRVGVLHVKAQLGESVRPADDSVNTQVADWPLEIQAASWLCLPWPVTCWLPVGVNIRYPRVLMA
jgi:hypothetical protein